MSIEHWPAYYISLHLPSANRVHPPAVQLLHVQGITALQGEVPRVLRFHERCVGGRKVTVLDYFKPDGFQCLKALGDSVQLGYRISFLRRIA